jgi:hypothetical protein
MSYPPDTAAVSAAFETQGTVPLVQCTYYRRSFIHPRRLPLPRSTELARPGLCVTVLWLPLLFPDSNISYSLECSRSVSLVCKARAQPPAHVICGSGVNSALKSILDLYWSPAAF